MHVSRSIAAIDAATETSVARLPILALVCRLFYADGSYLTLCDRCSGWLSVYCFAKDDSKSVIGALRRHFARYGIAKVVHIRTTHPV